MGDIADIRSDVAAAFEKVEAAPESVAVEAPSAARAESAEPAKETPSAETAPETSGRDEKGRFTSSKPAAEKVSDPPAAAETPAGAATVPTVVAPAASVSDLKAPQSWKPEAREKWASMPPEAQQEAIRLDRVYAYEREQTAEARKLSQAFNTVVAPYEAMVRRLGAQHPLQAVQNAFQTLDILHNGSPQQRADTLATIIKQSIGVDEPAMNMLAASLEGKPGQATVPAQNHLTPDKVQAMVQAEFDRARQQSAAAQAQEMLSSFSKDAEFLNDVKPVVMALLKSGVASDLKSAYEQACWADPKIRAIRQQREASKQAATGAEATQRAKAAASSVRSTPSGANGAAPEPKDWRDAIRSSMEKAEK